MISDLRSEEINLVYPIYLRAQLQTSAPIGPEWTQSQFAEEAAHGGLVLRENESVLAFLLYRDVTEAYEISLLVTDISSLRQGCMSRLLKELISRASKSANELIFHPKAVWLEVHEQNYPARQLYEKLGFQSVGMRRRYYRDGGGAVLYNYG